MPQHPDDVLMDLLLRQQGRTTPSTSAAAAAAAAAGAPLSKATGIGAAPPNLLEKLFSTLGYKSLEKAQKQTAHPFDAAEMLQGAQIQQGEPEMLTGDVPGGIGKAGPTLQFMGKMLPNIYRAALLAEPTSLTINTIAAPWGAGNIGAIERMISESLKGNPAMARKYINALANLWNPIEHPKRFFQATREAGRLLHGPLERAEYMKVAAPGTATRAIEKGVSFPGSMMFAGDLATRKAWTAAGIPEHLARRATLTYNPTTSAGEGVVEFAKRHPSLAMLQPFSRTAVNIVESGIERTPILGWVFNANSNPKFRQHIAETATQQGMGFAVYEVGKYIGSNTDPQTARENQIYKLAANMSGQYGMLMMAGIAAGVAEQTGRATGPSFWPGMSQAIGSAFSELPLPQTGGPMDVINAGIAAMKGEDYRPEAEYWPERHLPRTLMPGFLQDEWIERFSGPQQRPGRRVGFSVPPPTP